MIVNRNVEIVHRIKMAKKEKTEKSRFLKARRKKMERKFMKKGSREKDHLIVPNEKST